MNLDKSEIERLMNPKIDDIIFALQNYHIIYEDQFEFLDVVNMTDKNTCLVAEVLSKNGYSKEILSLGFPVPEQGYMYALFDPEYFDDHFQDIEKGVIDHFTK